nr:fatty acid amide hydrolase-like [Tanacetum cinerariifolium]
MKAWVLRLLQRQLFNKLKKQLEYLIDLGITGLDTLENFYCCAVEAAQSVSHILLNWEFRDCKGKSGERVESTIRCLFHLDPASNHGSCSTPFRCKKIRDTAYSYRQKLATPSMANKRITKDG